MPKHPTFKKIYPTLRNPFNSNQNLEFHATLRERTNILLQPPVSTSISLLPPIDPTTINNNPTRSKQEIVPKYIASNNTFNIADVSFTNQDEFHREYPLNDQENFSLDTIEAISQYTDNESLILEHFSPLYSRSTSPVFSLAEQDPCNEVPIDNNSDNLNNIPISAGQTNCYDTNTELPGYTGDSGPYFPSITAMWMFIWFTKNMIGTVY